MKKTEYKIQYHNFENIKTEGVYLIRNIDSNKLKIGITNNLMRRLSEIQKSFQFCGVIPELKIECFIEYKHNLELEQYLHKQLKEYNYQNEWFSIDDINIILDKLTDFEHIQPIKNDNIKNKKVKISKFDIDEYKYYKYKFEERDIDCVVYFKRKRTRYGVDYVISKIAESVGYMWSSYILKDWELEELKSDYDTLDKLFLKFDTDTIALVDSTYMRLDIYLGNILRQRKLETIINNKDEIIKIINQITNIKEYDCNNIDIIKSDIINIEEKCIRIQEYLNESIEQHHRENYKMLGLN